MPRRVDQTPRRVDAWSQRSRPAPPRHPREGGGVQTHMTNQTLDSRFRGNDGQVPAFAGLPAAAPPRLVTPAKAGAQTRVTGRPMDSRLRGNDGQVPAFAGLPAAAR